MAKLLDKDPFTYQQEKDGFLRDLKLFHANRGTPVPGLPTIRGKVVDLYLLHHKVAALGGCDKVNDNQQWEEIQELFHVPLACCNAGQALKNIYYRYVAAYVKSPEQGDYEEDDESRRNRQKRPASSSFGSVPQKYNYHQHNVSDYVRKEAGMATKFVEENEYHKLEKALLSGLPNEVDFAINVCTLLSNEGKRTIRVSRCQRLVHLLLAHAGIFEHGPRSFFKLYENWRNGRNYLKFWHDSIIDPEIRELINPCSLLEDKGGVIDKALVSRLFEEGDESMREDTLHLGRELGVHDVEGQRILQVMMIFRNISFEEENMSALASDPLVFRFLLLCVHCKYSTLRQLALDTLGNIALQMVLDPIDYRTTQLILQTVTRCLAACDRFQVVRGMEILSRLCQVERNEEMLSENLETRVYEDVVRMLTVQDIQLIVYTLECLYQLSELGDLTCSHIAGIRGAVETLVSLTTVEAQSYGPQSLMGIKVVEHVPAGVAAAQAQQQQQVAPPQPAAASHAPPTSQARPMVPVHRSTPPPPHAQRPGVVQTPPPAARPSQPHPPPQDADTIACNWLRSQYEPCQDGTVLRMEMYADYLACCSRNHLRHVTNVNSYANCIRIVFPKVETMQVDKEDGTTAAQIKGVKKRPNPLPFPPPIDRSASPHHHKLQPRPPTPNIGLATPPAPPTSSGRQVNRRLLPGPLQPSRPVAPIVGPNQHSQSVLQQQLNSPPLPSQPQYSPTETAAQKDQYCPQFPTIQQALIGPQTTPTPVAPPAVATLPQDPVPTHPAGAPGVPGFPGTRHNRPPDSNLIKSLLANKVTQNMHKMQLQQQQQQQQQQQMLTAAHPATAAPQPGEQANVLSAPPQPNPAPQPQPVSQLVPQQRLAVPPPPQAVQQLVTPAAAVIPPQPIADVPDINNLHDDSRTDPSTADGLRVVDPQPSCVKDPSAVHAGTEPTSPVCDKSPHQPCLPVNRPPSRRRSGSPGSSPVRPSAPGSPRPGSPGRAKSPKAGHSPRSKSPRPPGSGSPHTQAMILEVCSHAERAGDVVQQEGHHMAQIERVENVPKGTDANQAQIEKIEDVQELQDQEAKIERVENTYVALLQEEVKKQAECIDGGMDNRIRAVSPISCEESQLNSTRDSQAEPVSLSEAQPVLDKAPPGSLGVAETLHASGTAGSKPLLESVQKQITAAKQLVSSGPLLNCVDDQVVPESVLNNVPAEQDRSPQSPVLESRLDINVSTICPGSPLVNGTNSDSSSSQCDPVLASVQPSSPSSTNPLPQLPNSEPVASVSPGKRGNTDKPVQTFGEIEEKKARLVAQLLEDKQALHGQVFAVNGMVNHIGNGDCHLAFEKDKMSLLKEKSMDRTYEKSSLGVPNTQGDPKPGNVIMSNGYASPQPEDLLCEEARKSGVDSVSKQPCQAQKSVIDCVSNQVRTNLNNSQDQTPVCGEPMDVDQPHVTLAAKSIDGDGSRQLGLPESEVCKISNSSAASMVRTAPVINTSSQSQELNSQPVQNLVGKANAVPVCLSEQNQFHLTPDHTQVGGAAPNSTPVQHGIVSQPFPSQQVAAASHAVLPVDGQEETEQQQPPAASRSEVTDSQNIPGKSKASMTIAELLQHRAVVRHPVPPSHVTAGAGPNQPASAPQHTVTMNSVQPVLPNPQISFVQQSLPPTSAAQQHQQLAAKLAAPLSVRPTSMLPPAQQTNLSVTQQPRMVLNLPVSQVKSYVSQGQPIITAALQGPTKMQISLASGTTPATVTVISQQTVPHQPVVVRAPIAPIAMGPIIGPPVITTPPPISPVEVKSPMVSPGQKRPATTSTPREHGGKKKKSVSRSSSIDSRRSSNQSLPGQEYMCEWQGCRRCFESGRAVGVHVMKTHFNKQAMYAVCLWDGCDGLRRQRWSLVTHFQDKHLTEHALKAACLRRQQMATSGSSPAPTNTPGPHVPPPVYPQDAAYQAIRRFTPRPPYPEFIEMKEGPVTKHIRLTSALILRNLARYSALGRSLLKKHEEHLAYVALSSLEASTSLAHCLFELKDKHHGPPNPHAITHCEESV